MARFCMRCETNNRTDCLLCKESRARKGMLNPAGLDDETHTVCEKFHKVRPNRSEVWCEYFECFYIGEYGERLEWRTGG